jgi:AcrR family transcriptional regulator
MTKAEEAAQPDPVEVHVRLLDAAEECFAQYGLAKTTMEDVARAAGSSRATVYRYFKNRDELLMGVVEREALSAADEIRSKIEGISNLGEYIVEGIVQALQVIPKRPTLSMLFLAESVGPASRVLLTSERMTNVGLGIILPVIEPAGAKGLLRENVDLAMMIEWIFRIIASYLSVPSPRVQNKDDMRELLRKMLLPSLLG